MRLANLKVPEETVSYQQAVRRGLGSRLGLFFPLEIPKLDDVDALLAMPFVARSARILGALIGDEIPAVTLERMLAEAFAFPAPVAQVAARIHALELFHGPTLAFKDFGARFMAQCLSHFAGGQTITILTATSGDTGAAVAHAFHGVAGVRAVILYPRGKVTPLQEKLFATLGGNIHAAAVEADFDACQSLVKQAFDDDELHAAMPLNSANSINISRLIAQICYYFEGLAQLPTRERVAVSVPCGNFGNLTAGMLARAMGAPIARFIAAVNANDTVPRFLAEGAWRPHPTVRTLSNAMDVSQPNNFPRILALADRCGWDLPRELHARAIDDATTMQTIRELHGLGYLSEPHGAVAYRCLADHLAPDETGLFLCTAHPAKFKETVEEALSLSVPLPPPLAAVRDKPLLSKVLPPEFQAFKTMLLDLH